MSRRRPALLTRRGRTRIRHRAYALAAAAGGIGWAWHTHPGAVVALGALAAAVAAYRLRHRIAPLIAGRRQPTPEADTRPTGLYQHWFAESHIRPWIDAGCPRSWFGYTGISVAYALRCEQHAEKAWWWPLVDANLSTLQLWNTRDEAEAAELATIAEYCGVGNEIGNPRFREQAQLRAELMAYAARVRAQQLTYARTG